MYLFNPYLNEIWLRTSILMINLLKWNINENLKQKHYFKIFIAIIYRNI